MKNKYFAKKTVRDGHQFASLKEMAHYEQLRNAQNAGHISQLKLQPRYDFEINGKPLKIRSKGFPNGRKVTYRPDFEYVRDGKLCVIDVKGYGQARGQLDSKLRIALMEACHDIRVEVVR